MVGVDSGVTFKGSHHGEKADNVWIQALFQSDGFPKENSNLWFNWIKTARMRTLFISGHGQTYKRQMMEIEIYEINQDM